MALGGGRLGTALTEHVVGQLPRQSSSTRFALTGASSTSASRARCAPVPRACRAWPRKLLSPTSSLLEDELDDRPLVGGELVEGGVRRTMEAGPRDRSHIPQPGTLDHVLGFELVEADAGVVRARFAVEDRVRQPLGLVHGGAYAALAESMTSAATYMAVAEGATSRSGNRTARASCGRSLGARSTPRRPAPQRPHHLDLGRGVPRRRAPAVRGLTGDDRGAPGAAGGDETAGAAPTRRPRPQSSRRAYSPRPKVSSKPSKR